MDIKRTKIFFPSKISVHISTLTVGLFQGSVLKAVHGSETQAGKGKVFCVGEVSAVRRARLGACPMKVGAIQGALG